MLVERASAQVYDFADNDVPGSTERDRGYWRDVGTLDAYYEAHMDLISVHPVFNLYNNEWPIYTAHDPLPPAKFVHNDERPGRPGDRLAGLRGRDRLRRRWSSARSSPPASCCTPRPQVDGHGADGQRRRSGRGAVVRNAIIDKNVVIPDGARIGVDLEYDRGRFTVTQNGIVVIGKNEIVER